MAREEGKRKGRGKGGLVITILLDKVTHLLTLPYFLNSDSVGAEETHITHSLECVDFVYDFHNSTVTKSMEVQLSTFTGNSSKKNSVSAGQ